MLRILGPEDIAVNMVTNNIYILTNGIVIVFHSNTGTVTTIPVGNTGKSCPYCLGVDSVNNKIYVANPGSDTVSVIDGNSDTVIVTIPVGHHPTFLRNRPSIIFYPPSSYADLLFLTFLRFLYASP